VDLDDRLLMLATRQSAVRLVLALIALAMLNYAAVQSIVMQAVAGETASASSMCAQTSMAGMAMPGGGGVHTHGAQHRGVCPYCAAAANPPIMATVALVRVPASFVFVSFQVVESHGPRGPPTVDPRARGPPPAITSA
jgi:hypothetical protein